MYTDLEIVGREGAEDLWWNIQAWGARQREIAVQILATHGVLHRPADQNATPFQQQTQTQLQEKLPCGLTSDGL